MQVVCCVQINLKSLKSLSTWPFVFLCSEFFLIHAHKVNLSQCHCGYGG